MSTAGPVGTFCELMFASCITGEFLDVAPTECEFTKLGAPDFVNMVPAGCEPANLGTLVLTARGSTLVGVAILAARVTVWLGERAFQTTCDAGGDVMLDDEPPL